MAPQLLTKGLILFAIARCVLSATYSVSDVLTGENLLGAFTWETINDPNRGRVNYVDYETAQSQGLVAVNGDQVTLRADSTTVLDPNGPGRDSFYLRSNAHYTTHVAVFDIAHMPTGCGTWPAVWLVESYASELGDAANWPNGGEIDILEGVNDQSPDRISLHTSAGCTMPPNRPMSGTDDGDNCDVYETNNEGCGVSVNTPNSFGPGFNTAAGGWYAIERTPSFIKVFFWPRSQAPGDVANHGNTVDTDNWGEPVAYFPSSATCNINTYLEPFNIVIDLDFCGTWAGGTYGQSGCPMSCVEYVNQEASAFGNAYFTFNAIRIYE